MRGIIYILLLFSNIYISTAFILFTSEDIGHFKSKIMEKRPAIKSSIIQQRIADKRAELENLSDIKKLTSNLTSQLEQLESKLDYMAEGTESVALVLSTWQNVVRSVSLASLGILKYGEKDYEEGCPLPESLVRIRLDKDQEQEDQE